MAKNGKKMANKVTIFKQNLVAFLNNWQQMFLLLYNSMYGTSACIAGY